MLNFVFRRYDVDSFFRALKIAYKEKEGSPMYSVEKVIRVWEKQEGYLVLNIFRDYKYIENVYLPSNKIKISVENLSLLKSKWISLSFTTQTSPDFNKTTPSTWYNLPDEAFKPPYQHNLIYSLSYREDGWIIFNIQQTGKF